MVVEVANAVAFSRSTAFTEIVHVPSKRPGAGDVQITTNRCCDIPPIVICNVHVMANHDKDTRLRKPATSNNFIVFGRFLGIFEDFGKTKSKTSRRG